MHDDFHDLEDELKSLRPLAVSTALRDRLERELAAEPARRSYATATTWRSWKWAVWPSAAAAAIALVALWSRSVPMARPAADAQEIPGALAADVYKPVRADNVLYGTREEGAVTLADGTPARRVRSQYVDTITWKNPRTNASLSWSVPRDEVRIIPVSFQ
jgi:hypothetical protein